MKTMLFSFFVVILLSACCIKRDEPSPVLGSSSKADYTYTVHRSEYSTVNGCPGWGYTVYHAGSLLIAQPNIPVVSGLYGFETEEEAETAASMQITKIKNGNTAFTIQELDSLLIGIKDSIKVDNRVILARSPYDSYCGCKGWGYIITFTNGVPYITQPHFPAVQGLNSFRSKQDALKCARMALDHSSQNSSYYVSPEDLEEAGLLDCD